MRLTTLALMATLMTAGPLAAQTTNPAAGLSPVVHRGGHDRHRGGVLLFVLAAAAVLGGTVALVADHSSSN